MANGKNETWLNVLLIISIILVIVGALNWGIIGLTSTNLVNSFNNATFRSSTFERIIYVLVGLAGVFLLIYLIKNWNNMHM